MGATARVWCAWWWWCVWWSVCRAADAQQALGGGGSAGGLGCSPAANETGHCRYISYSSNEYNFIVEGIQVGISFQESNFFKITCNGKVSLESASMPRFRRAVRVRAVTVQRCAVPAASYGDALHALNVTLAKEGQLSITGPAAGPALCARHLAPWPDLHLLVLQRLDPPCSTLLAPLTQLRALRVHNTPLPTDLLQSLPAKLESLWLQSTEVTFLPQSVFALLNLHSLTVKETHAVVLPENVTTSIKRIMLDVRNTSLPDNMSRIPALEDLLASYWNEEDPVPWRDCAHLVNLTLTFPAMRSLPDGWIASCPHLTRLMVTGANYLKSLPSDLLVNASRLTHLTFSYGQLESLPENLLDYVPRLTHLDLTSNRLQMLPGDMFTSSQALRELQLSRNDLSGEALHPINALTNLQTLNLAYNTALGDTCIGGNEYTIIANTGPSSISFLTGLRYLNLAHTSITRICRDWRLDMQSLAVLDLSHTRVTRLTFYDMEMNRHVEGAVVDLRGANVTALEFDRLQYERALKASRPKAEIKVDSRVRCDCTLYWAAAALHAAGGGWWELLSEVQCADGRSARLVPPEELLCPQPDKCTGLPAACECAEREDKALPRDSMVLRVRCEAAALPTVPRLPPNAAAAYHLLLAGNRIANITYHDLPENLWTLDVRNNSLEWVEEQAASALVGIQKLLLGGNRFQCKCEDKPLADALQRRRATGDARHDDIPLCVDGRALSSAPLYACAPTAYRDTALVIVLAALALCALACAACLARPQSRRRLKAVVRGLGWASGGVAEPRLHDIFVSFGAKEDAKVALELTRRLEGGARPYRVHAQERDWVAGCDVAESVSAAVLAARRTVVVASRHWASRWAALRASYAPALREARLVLVLVEADALAAVPELQRYAADHKLSVLLWHQERLEARLRRTLPKPRSPPAPAPADPPPPRHPPAPPSAAGAA